MVGVVQPYYWPLAAVLLLLLSKGKMLMRWRKRLVVGWNLWWMFWSYRGRLIGTGRLILLLRIIHVRLLSSEHLHVLPNQVGNLERLCGCEYNLGLFLVRTGDDHETVHVGRKGQYRLVVVGAEGVSRAMLEQM
uniref:Putative secreted protein n=1 Tax=Anopheles darlingi TaxID=43151 RepID=A0A2M4D2M1_ANODA